MTISDSTDRAGRIDDRITASIERIRAIALRDANASGWAAADMALDTRAFAVVELAWAATEAESLPGYDRLSWYRLRLSNLEHRALLMLDHVADEDKLGEVAFEVNLARYHQAVADLVSPVPKQSVTPYPIRTSH